MAKTKEESPLMKQYNNIKAKYPGALVLFRVGDFYETFGEDAIKASKILNITLTKRGAGSMSEIELAGFPYHSLDNYMPKLVRAGQRVAVCDQLEDAKFVKGIVKRGVTELVTPGVSYNDSVLDVRQNNYLAALHFVQDQIGAAFLDISTGDFFTTQGSISYIEKLIQSLNPAEIIYSKTHKTIYNQLFADKYSIFQLDDWIFGTDFATEQLTNHFNTQSLKGFGIDMMPFGIIASGAILHYLKETEHHEVKHISTISRMEEDRYMWLDKFTIRNLELVYPQFEGGVPLIDILDQTTTPMGSRLLKKWVVMPLKELTLIQERQLVVSTFYKNKDLQSALVDMMKPIGDLERLISKVAAKRVLPREITMLKRSLDQLPHIQELLKKYPSLSKQADMLAMCSHLNEQITKTLQPEVSVQLNTGNLICEGIDEELDDLKKIAFSGKDYLLQIQQREIEKTGIGSLKILYNKVFGYYLEVTNTHKDKVPQDWIRKQTTVNSERYITEELKVYEEKILTAEDKIYAIENRIFIQLVLTCSEYILPIQQNAKVLAEIDCYLSFAAVSIKNKYCLPKLSDDSVLNIKAGRHPVIEKQLPPDEPYIPNDIYLDDEKQQIIVITGPNMAGKSALLRQTALIVIMAQIGCFVPADKAEIGLVDKVFTRVGASDNLSRGESTFMVEMTETASILNNLSHKSLVLMDEIGRGTSTYDGISIAWAIVEYLHNHPKSKPKTLFATHYHELNELTETLERVKNFNVSVKEIDQKIIFMRKLAPGGSEHSFGIHVAQIAGMPNQVLIRSNEIMHELEKDKIKTKNSAKLRQLPSPTFQTSLFEINDPKYQMVKDAFNKIDINTLSPVEALLKLNEMKILMEK